MIEDQLTRDERIRLECLNQAVTRGVGRHATDDELLEQAKRFERWVREGVT